MLTLVLGELHVDVSRAEASALVDYLWQGLQPGSVTSAAKLEQAVGRLSEFAAELAVFEPYEFDAVRAALVTQGLSGPNAA